MTNKRTVFIHLVTTGIDCVKDKIAKITLAKVDEDMEIIDTYEKLLTTNGIELSESASRQLGGMTAVDLLMEQPFAFYADEILDFISDSDIGGWSVQFHVNFLIQAFLQLLHQVL